jgi:hypothetical protein
VPGEPGENCRTAHLYYPFYRMRFPVKAEIFSEKTAAFPNNQENRYRRRSRGSLSHRSR